MKTTKKIISLLLTIQMLFSCALIPSVIATDSVVEEPIDAVEVPVTDEGESSEELSPRMANSCVGFNYNGGKSAEYAQNRGWDTSMIYSAINNGAKGYSVNKANGCLCTVYCYPGTSYYELFPRSKFSIRHSFYCTGTVVKIVCSDV